MAMKSSVIAYAELIHFLSKEEHVFREKGRLLHCTGKSGIEPEVCQNYENEPIGFSKHDNLDEMYFVAEYCWENNS